MPPATDARLGRARRIHSSAINPHHHRPSRRPARHRQPLGGLMDAYPARLGSADNSGGLPTPTHGGLVAGPEYDVPITQRPAASPPRTPDAQHTPNMERAERTERVGRARPQPSSQKPRPVSMPPQAYAPPAATNGDRDQRYDDTRHGRSEGGSSSKSRSGTRILGDYTLSKTLGAGSMGKVKLAHHNITGEKVSTPFCCLHGCPGA